MIFYRFSLFLWLSLFSLLPTIAEAHRPYFVDYSGWVVEGQEEYQLQGWYGDGIFFSDPVRVVLRSRNGGVSAVTATGAQASGYCPALDFCWGFTFDLSGIFPTLWRLSPPEMERAPKQREKKDFGYPETSKDMPRGFKISYNYFMLPIAWATVLPRLSHSLILVVPVFAAFLAFWYGAKLVKKISPANSATRALKNLTVAILVLLITGATILMVVVSLLHGLGLVTALLFATWMGVGKIRSLRHSVR